ncbi:hypothetical protein ACEU6E_10910 (plasmid) [Halorutilales archaeon Cl-col2-1]
MSNVSSTFDNEVSEKVATSSPYKLAERETLIRFPGDKDTARVESFELGVARRLLRHKDFAPQYVYLNLDKRVKRVHFDDYDSEAEIVGVTGFIPVNNLSITKGRKSKHHAKIVSRGGILSE